MSDQARPDPPEKEWPRRRSFDLKRVYCAHCAVHPAAEGFEDMPAMRTHLVDAHDVPRAKAEKGEDYLEGWQARMIYLRRAAEAEVASRRAARYLVQPNYSVQDFLTDAGDEPWPALDGEA